MGVGDQKRFFSWLSQLEDAEPVIPQADDHPAARFTFDGIPSTKQALDTKLAASQEQLSQPVNWQQTRLETENIERTPSTRCKANRGDSKVSGKEKNGYERIPRSKTKEDRYDYKGKSSRLNSEHGMSTRKNKTSKQKRKHTINEGFHASNVPPARLTLQSTSKLGIFNKGKRSSSVKCRVVLDQGFSETEFLTKTSAYEHVNRPLRPTKYVDMFNYDTETGYSCQSNEEPKGELLSYMEENHRPTPSPNLEPPQGDTAIYHTFKGGHTARTAKGSTHIEGPSDHVLQETEEGIRCESVRAFPQTEQSMPYRAPTSTGESFTQQALDFEWHFPGSGVTEDSPKKYWTLEELKHLLQQRMLSWQLDKQESIQTSNPGSQQLPRKRSHSPLQYQGSINAEHITKKVNGPSQRMQDYQTDRCTRPRTTLLDHISLLDGLVDVQPEDQFLAHWQATHSIARSPVPPQPSCDIDASMFYEDTPLMTQAFEAAYEAIMRPEQAIAQDMPENTPITNSNIGSRERNAPTVLQGRWEWDEEASYPIRMGQEILLSNKSRLEELYQTSNIAGTINPSQRVSWLSGGYIGQQPFSLVERDPAGAVETFKRDNPANQVGAEVGGMQNFWRRNRLY
ncbi:hypothetical protein BJX99DRAFT_252744 [Aspergillus californicus]